MRGQSHVSVLLRPLMAADLVTVTALEGDLFGPSAWSSAMLAEELEGPGRWYLAADLPAEPSSLAERLVGYAGLWFDGDDAQVMTIAVSQAHQSRGIGGALLGALIRRAKDLGARSMLLEVRVDNAPALALYERFGFQRLGLRRGYYQPENIDAWTMRFALPGREQAQPAVGASLRQGRSLTETSLTETSLTETSGAGTDSAGRS
ncbi:ribosomal protein S18-alanine N-acetyltransferase [Pengzhenrongella frigida]|uniref:Ribosomal-protein-alanine N-acetyltransferase n=1 Tax=Pengzhenrongella frigida TaxID=1259133 RepID=A0A4Q5N1V8_9MICO|nr:ribosomal protein S18-alanine N-acetyltransferase [Cellulomonas sp. HLT2-17]RYV52172.1 ribosomal-protein-alanine N-acetyltransferase [Cellulomonas sp. HLT2-17]